MTLSSTVSISHDRASLGQSSLAVGKTTSYHRIPLKPELTKIMGMNQCQTFPVSLQHNHQITVKVKLSFLVYKNKIVNKLLSNIPLHKNRPRVR